MKGRNFPRVYWSESKRNYQENLSSGKLPLHSRSPCNRSSTRHHLEEHTKEIYHILRLTLCLTIINPEKDKTREPLSLKLLNKLDSTSNCKEILICWIPSHIWMRGNERADSAAKSALGLTPTNSEFRILVALYEWSAKQTIPLSVLARNQTKDFWTWNLAVSGSGKGTQKSVGWTKELAGVGDGTAERRVSRRVGVELRTDAVDSGDSSREDRVKRRRLSQDVGIPVALWNFR